MKYDIYSDGQLIYSTDAPAAQVQLRQDEQVALHGSSELLTQDAWADLITTDTGLQAIPTRAITYWAFRRRFEHAERVAIELAALDDPAAALPQRQLAASVRVYLADADAAAWIDLDDPDARNGVHALEAAGLMAPGRGLAILDDPVIPSERPPGTA